MNAAVLCCETIFGMWVEDIITRGQMPAVVWSDSPNCRRPRTGRSPGSDPGCRGRSCPAGETGLFDKRQICRGINTF